MRQTLYSSYGRSSSGGRIFSSIFGRRTARGHGGSPEAQQQFRQIAHAHLPKRLPRRKLELARAQGGAFRGVSAQLGVQPGGARVRIGNFSRLGLQLSLPVLSFLLMRLQMIKKQLFAPVEAHRRHRGPDGR